MKTAQIENYGDTSVIEIRDIAVPDPAAGQVQIKIAASSINPFDYKLRSGMFKDMIPLQLPVTLGGDLAGTVTAIGEGVSDFAIGDTVYGQANAVAGNSGAFAETAVTAAEQIAKAPKRLTALEAASLPLVGVSALQALREHLNLQKGQKIFIHGGAGGIGSIAIQIAKHTGAYVATTATGDRIEFVKKLGADEVIDYKTEKFQTVLKDFDAVFDTVGGNDFVLTLSILKPGGTAVSMAAQADEAEAAKRQVSALTQNTQVTKGRLEELRELIDNGVVSPQIGGVFPLEKIQEAFTALESRKFPGKVVLEIA